jgi:phosphatidate phosphatase LPIN
MSIESLVEENVAEQVSNPEASTMIKEEAPTPREIDIALEKADIVEKQMLAGTKEDGEVVASTFNEEVHKNLEKHKSSSSDLPSKTRSMSGTSILSDLSSNEDGIGIYTTIDDGRSVRYKRTLRLKSDQLKDLQLQYGSNDARFSISTKIQGTAWCACHIYLLRWCEKIVISDVDGTITKSDVLGHIIPAIGGTWAHTSIVDLYGRIQNNG